MHYHSQSVAPHTGDNQRMANNNKKLQIEEIRSLA
jgi:hypothetical protein